MAAEVLSEEISEVAQWLRYISAMCFSVNKNINIKTDEKHMKET